VRVVLDTNVIVSALISPGGTTRLVYDAVISRSLQLVTSRALLGEVRRVLTHKFHWSTQATEAALDQLERLGEVADAREAIAVITDDPADNRVLEAALAGRAEVIVSGDRHLLTLGEWRGIPIRTPREIADHLGLGEPRP
jgi:uncharacterized protein